MPSAFTGKTPVHKADYSSDVRVVRPKKGNARRWVEDNVCLSRCDWMGAKTRRASVAPSRKAPAKE